jgi:hypothetical protein
MHILPPVYCRIIFAGESENRVSNATMCPSEAKEYDNRTLLIMITMPIFTGKSAGLTCDFVTQFPQMACSPKEVATAKVVTTINNVLAFEGNSAFFLIRWPVATCL